MDSLGPDERGIVPGTDTGCWLRCGDLALGSGRQMGPPSRCGRLTLSTDASQVRDLHQHLGEHVGAAGPPFPHVDLQRLKQRLLQHVHPVWLLQVLPV